MDFKKLVSLVVVGFALAVNTHAQSFLTNGLVAFFPFNGSAADASGNGHNGVVTGATLATNRFGNANQAYLFSGTNSFITVPLNSSVFTNDFTASVWFNVQDFANDYLQILFEQGNSLSLSIPGFFSPGTGRLIAYSSYAPATFAWYLERTQQTPIGVFHHVVITKAGTSVTMYLNSQVARTGSVSVPNFVVGTNLYIGRELNNEFGGDINSVFHGVIDDVRIYNRAFSSNEVAQLNTIESVEVLNVKRAVYLDSPNLKVGTNYQVQVSGNLVNWTNYGSAFAATNSTWRSTNYWDVDNWNQLYFRLQKQ